MVRYEGVTFALVSRDLYDAEVAARAREEARALAAEAELARGRAEAERVRAFYEEREAKIKARIGGEMLRAERAEDALILEQLISGGRGALLQSYYLKVEEMFREIARLRAVVARLQEVPLSEEGLDDA